MQWPKVQQSAFTEASFTGLSDIHWCSGGLYKAQTCLTKQTAGRELPQDWLVRLGINVTIDIVMCVDENSLN